MTDDAEAPGADGLEGGVTNPGLPDDGGTGDTAMESADPDVVVRTLKLEVVFAGWREDDLRALWAELWKAQDDLRLAGNKALAALYQLKLGVLPWPQTEAKKGKDKGKLRNTPLQGLCYQCMSGKWQPFGEPMYKPSTAQPVSSNTLLELAGVLYTRIKSDWVDIAHGKKQLPTFRNVAIGSPYVTVDKESGRISFSLWAGRKGRITVQPRKMSGRMWSDLRRAVKYGGCRLVWDQPPGRKGRWMLSLSVHLPRRTRETKPVTAAVRLGLYTTCTIAYVDQQTGKVSRTLDTVDLPASVWRAVRRVERERTERGRWNRKDRGQRSGRGRKRKLRAVEDLGDVVARVNDTAIRQVSAAVVAAAKRKGATVLALPDLAHWSVAREMDRTEPLPEEPRAEHRKRYFAWHQGALRQRITEAAEREGFKVITVSVADLASTCAECGKVDKSPREGQRWHCECGYKTSVAENTARVLARRAVA